MTSVIIPTYNEDYYLEPCLEHLMRQTVPIDEIIVVDNNTTDKSVERVKKKFPDARYLKEGAQGLVYARNTGFDAASGDILVKIDADTLVDEDWHEHLLRDIKDSGADAWTGYVYTTELNALGSLPSKHIFNFFTFRSNSLVAGVPMILGCNMALTRRAWEKIRPDVQMRGDIWEDLDMAVLVKRAGFKTYISRTARTQISVRSANAPLRSIAWRLYGQSKVYLTYKKYLSYAVSVVMVGVGCMVIGVLRAISFPGKKIRERPRKEQR